MGWIVDLDLGVIEHPAQVVVHRLALGGVGRQHLVEHLGAVAAVALGPGQCGLGPLEEGLGIVVGKRRPRSPR